MITLLASIAGFLTSIIPEMIKFLKDKHDKKHELQLLNLQAKYTLELQNREIEEIGFRHDMNLQKSIYSTYNTGVSWVDALNGTVRPVLAYSFFIIYAGVKFVQYGFLISHNALVENLDILWDIDDQAIFAGIISFYFGQRGFRQHKRGKR